MDKQERERRPVRDRRYTADGEEILPGFFCDYGRETGNGGTVVTYRPPGYYEFSGQELDGKEGSE